MDYGKYKNALEKAKVRYNEIKGTNCSEEKFLLELFPELKENKDRIRQGLIKALSSIGKRNWGGIDVFESIAWLEKQGEQKVPINDFKAKNWYVSEVDGKIHDMTYNPADKVEPKFKVGDWIINNQGSAFQIAYIDEENSRYVFEIGGYTKEEMNYESIAFANNHYRKWTIDDAKDGDVLACGDKVTDCPFIFHNLTEELNPRSYCGVNTSGDFQYNDENGGFWCKSDEVRPATKEQRDLLFQKMKEAGYQWDAKKKELKLLISNGGDFESNNSKDRSIL